MLKTGMTCKKYCSRICFGAEKQSAKQPNHHITHSLMVLRVVQTPMPFVTLRDKTATLLFGLAQASFNLGLNAYQTSSAALGPPFMHGSSFPKAV